MTRHHPENVRTPKPGRRPLRLSRWEQQPQPRHKDTIECGQLLIKVGPHNGDFRSITIEDFQGRPIAFGDIPYRALQEIIDAGGSYIAYIPEG